MTPLLVVDVAEIARVILKGLGLPTTEVRG